MKKLTSGLALLAISTLLITLFSIPAQADNTKVGVKDFQITTDPRYDRNPSFFRASDGTYWLFFARGRDTRGIRDLDDYNPDLDYYDIFYKTAKSIPELQKTKEKIIPLKPPDNAQRDISALQMKDGKIWVFTSTGLGPGSERSTFYYIYDGTWQGPFSIPNTYDAHVNALEYNGKIWVFFDDGAYLLKVVWYDAAIKTWSYPIEVANHATIAKAIVDDGKFYVVWAYLDDANNQWGTGIYLSTSENGIDWKSTEGPIADWPDASATNWDPVLSKDNNMFRLFWAPDVGYGGQFIATSTSKNPTDMASWSVPTKITKSSFGAKNWWDFWPQPYTKGTEYLIYTSEKNATATDRADGNIWMLHLKP
jgi:hypothetical protein